MSSYDFVIIGGGTAGLVMANRLTEDPNITVAVLEAGTHRPDDPKINIPGLWTQLYGDEIYDWNFKTKPQPHLGNHTIAWPRGRVLGGSSTINFMMQTDASAEDLDIWEKLGNPGWNFKTLAPYYRKFETFNPPDDAVIDALNVRYIKPEVHGTRGPVQASFPRGTGPGDSVWGPTNDALDIGVKGDPRDGNTLGGYSILKYIDNNGKRSTAASSYYAPVAERTNLKLIEGALVTKIVLDETTGSAPTANGVEYVVDGQTAAVHATREVILSAGSVMSPKILELSGVGSRAILSQLDVKTVVENAAVGENLQDHVITGLGYEAKPGIPTAETLRQPGVLDWAMNLYDDSGAGPLAAGVTGSGFYSHQQMLKQLPAFSKPLAEAINSATSIHGQTQTPSQAKQLAMHASLLTNPTEADLQINFGPTGINPAAHADISALFAHPDPGNYLALLPVPTHPLSRGSIHIASPDPQVPPTIDPNYFSHPVDAELVALGLAFTQVLARTRPLADLLVDEDPQPPSVSSVDSANNDSTTTTTTGSSIVEKKTQPAFALPPGTLSHSLALHVARQGSLTCFHPVATCSMLPRAEGGVVDPTLKVYGVQKLRVVDASVIPFNPRGNIVSAVYALAERAADLVKGEWASEGGA